MVKMKRSRDSKCLLNLIKTSAGRSAVPKHYFSIILCYFFIFTNHNSYLISAKSLNSTIEKDNTKAPSCDAVTKFFDSINIAIVPDYENKGSICGGHCCTNVTEDDLMEKSTANFERYLRHHTKSLRGILETTSTSFKDHVLVLSQQSENKTLTVFSQVYRRMLPLSRQLIHDLYTNIRSQITTSEENDLEDAVHKFFINLFPVAYHQAVHLNNDGGSTGDLNDDYISCLKETFDDLQPFGDIPKELGKNLIQSVSAANVFINSLKSAADVLASTDELDSEYLTRQCQTQLLKMSYCPQCNGYTKHHPKPCFGYCVNVMRGCVAQYVGVLDSSWSNVAEAIERLVSTSIQSDNGIVNIIKGLDGKLSEAIMRAMENGPALEMKVKKTCGTPKLLPVDKTIGNDVRPHQQQLKWATPSDATLLNFLATISKSRDFYSKIVDALCEDEEYQRNDRHCWTGDRIGEYTQTIMSNGVDAQRYNPEVPHVPHSYAKTTKLNELVDKLIKLRSTIVNSLPTNPRSYSDIQGDMARHDEEGSGGGLRDEFDDEEYNSINASGDGSGDGPTSTPDYTLVSPRTTGSGSSTVRIVPFVYVFQTLVFLIAARITTGGQHTLRLFTH